MRTTAWQVLREWVAIPFTRSGRRSFLWFVSMDVPQTARSSGALPQLTWSQDGEDLLFEELFPADGFYVDVGAHHPDRFSVTRKLYERGWRGVNIDASPGFARVFQQRRARDTSITALVGRSRQATFWRFREATLSTLDADRATQLIDLGWELEGKESVSVRSLTEILAQCSAPPVIDLLSVDVEGEDLEALTSLDWGRWTVSRCLVEIVLPAFEVPNDPVAQFLNRQGLRLTRVWGRSCLFERDFRSDGLARRH